MDQNSIPDTALSVVMTPIQLAAVFERASISQGETRTNRIWGTVGLVGGVLELLGSAAALVGPTPALAKVAGTVGLLHGADVVSTSWDQIRSGSNVPTQTARSVTTLAQALGASEQIATISGAIVDIAVPTSAAVAISRSLRLARLSGVKSVTKGQIDILQNDLLFQFPHAPKSSAHTVRDHISKTASKLEERFVGEGRNIFSNSAFYDIETANIAISEVLRLNRNKIEFWIASSTKSSKDFIGRFEKPVGIGVFNAKKSPGLAALGAREVHHVKVVINKTDLNGNRYYVLTAFPDIKLDIVR